MRPPSPLSPSPACHEKCCFCSTHICCTSRGKTRKNPEATTSEATSNVFSYKLTATQTLKKKIGGYNLFICFSSSAITMITWKHLQTLIPGLHPRSFISRSPDGKGRGITHSGAGNTLHRLHNSVHSYLYLLHHPSPQFTLI